MELLQGKKILVTGVLTDDSLAYSVAKLAMENGASIMLTGAGRGLSLTRRTARRLGGDVEVAELDVTEQEQAAEVAKLVTSKWGSLDGILHAIGFAPQECLGNGMLQAGWDEVSIALNVSAYSLKSLVEPFIPLMEKAGGGSVVGLDFDATVAWPSYDWMGVAKAALESLSRYLARELGPKGIRVNMVAAGPIRTMAAKSIPGFADFKAVWDSRSPLGWDDRDPLPVAKACIALFSDLFPMTTGEILHVDGGVHAVGA